jgi:hypothetical protein
MGNFLLFPNIGTGAEVITHDLDLIMQMKSP